jgi:hypothetical protein
MVFLQMFDHRQDLLDFMILRKCAMGWRQVNIVHADRVLLLRDAYLSNKRLYGLELGQNILQLFL